MDSQAASIVILSGIADRHEDPEDVRYINGIKALREDNRIYVSVTMLNVHGATYEIVLRNATSETRAIFDSMVSTFRVL